MAKDSQIHTNKQTKDNTDSALAKFHLSFEYDRTWDQAKRDMQHKPVRN